MNAILREHRRDQVEAARKEFQRLWRDDLRHRVAALITNQRDWLMAEHVAWHAFLSGKLAQDLRKAAE